jgi:hypothetical protein
LPTSWTFQPSRILLSAILVLAVALGCTEEDAVPIDPANPPTTAGDLDLTDVTHSLEPTPQMEQLARQQCLDDQDAEQGYIEAVDPETGDTISAITVDCDEVRGG